MKYDDATWHSGAKDFPRGLASQSAATHIGMFVAWAIDNNLMSHEFIDDFAEQIQALKLRQLMPGEFVWKFMEGKFSEHDLNTQGQNFAAAYYRSEQPPSFLTDYEKTNSGDLKSEYLLPDDWVTYEKNRILIDQRFSNWCITQKC